MFANAQPQPLTVPPESPGEDHELDNRSQSPTIGRSSGLRVLPKSNSADVVRSASLTASRSAEGRARPPSTSPRASRYFIDNYIWAQTAPILHLCRLTARPISSPLPPCHPSPTPHAPSPNPRAPKRSRRRKIFGPQTRPYSRVPDVPNLPYILRKARSHPKKKKNRWQRNGRLMLPVPEPNPATSTPLLPSGGAIDINSSDPPVASSSKHPLPSVRATRLAPGTQTPACASSAQRKRRLWYLQRLFFSLRTFPSGFEFSNSPLLLSNRSSSSNHTGCDDIMGLGLFVRTCYRLCYALS
ncbi:hypothetical protein FRC12_016356 [Ceratobasidium sp. 428]|nr:hypothetical protein FRC12_016356 [Ceratobasidium sp. 428]